MALELDLLRVVKTREQFERLHRFVPRDAIDAITDVILRDFGSWFKEHPEAPEIDLPAFHTWFKIKHRKLDEEKLALIQKQLAGLKKAASPGVAEDMLNKLESLRHADEMVKLLTAWENGDEVDLMVESSRLIAEYEARVDKATKHKHDDTDIDELLDFEENMEGLKFRMPLLNQYIRPLGGGDFVIFASSVDAGKTSWVADQITHMASQIPEGKYVHWFCNEGPARKVKATIWRAALNMTFTEIQEFRVKKKGGHKLAYAKAVGGSDKIRVYNAHDWTTADIEAVLKKAPPGLIVYDMLDNVKFAGSTTNGGERSDQVLEALYQWGRIQSVKFDCPAFATSQISVDGYGMQYPLLHMLKDSKVGKQGAAEAVIMMGRKNDISAVGQRFLSAPKNKLARSDAIGQLMHEVVFDGARARFHEPEEIEYEGE